MKHFYPALKTVQTVSGAVKNGLVLGIFLCVMFATSAGAQTIRYVDGGAGGANDGSSWANAFIELQSALDASVPGDEIWVANGTYKPRKDMSGNANPGDLRTRTFKLKSGVDIYGGFSGSEILFEQRNVRANLTVLSGDIWNNDGPDFANNGDNNYHIITATGLTLPTIFDGFTVKGGHANNGGDYAGDHNAGNNGAGLYIASNNSTGTLTINNCVFTLNSALNYGGALYNTAGGIIVSNTVFQGNKAGSYSVGGGGGMFNVRYADIINCVFQGNESTGTGGGLDNNTGLTNIVNTVFVGNKAAGSGGGIYIAGSSLPEIVNCTIVGNSAQAGSGVYASSSSFSTKIKNSIIWDNMSGMFTATYSNLKSGLSGIGNISSEPFFGTPADPDGPDNIWGTPDDGLMLRESSPSVNSGNDADVPSGVLTDITGANRKQGIVNMGAYEAVKPAATIYVNASAVGPYTGTSWATAFDNLQSALEVAGVGDRIWVAKGIYKPSKDVDGNAFPSDNRTKTFLVDGVKLYGGFSGTETDLSERNPKINQTVLSGDHGGNDGANFANNGENAYHVLAVNTLSALTILDGFTIRGGNANGSGSFFDVSFGRSYGGGLIVASAGNHLQINQCSFISNYGNFGGGAIFLGAATGLQITSSVFADNSTANNYGGAIYLYHTSSSTTIVNSVFVRNTSSYQGGAIFNFAPGTSIINSTFTANKTTGFNTGAIHTRDNTLTLRNSIVWGNAGGNVVNENGSATVTNSNIEGSGVYPGTGNKNAGPAFVNASNLIGEDNIWGTADDGLHLLSTSPSADSGNDSDVPGSISTDIVGAIRKQSTVNMGAYETLKLAQTITGLPATDTKTYGDAVYTLSASGGASGNPVVYTSSDASIATISGNEVTIKNAGIVTITATQAGNGTYAAGSVTQTLSVNKRVIKVTADAKSKTYGDADPALTYEITSGSLVADDTFTGELSRTPGSEAGVYLINKNNLSLGSNYTLTYAIAYLTINKRAITVKADALGQTYGDENRELTYKVTAGSIVDGDSFTGALSRTAGNDAGVYVINQGNLSAGPNYTITFQTANLTIDKATLTVKANNANRVYGNPNPAFTFTFGGFKNSDTESSLGLPGSITGSTAATLTSAAGSTHTITPGNLPALTNYTLTGQTGTLTIDKATLTVKANDDSREYGSANPAFSFSFSGFKNSDTESSLGLPGSITGNTTATLTSAAGGAYPITPGNFPTLTNYSFAGSNGTLAITKAVLTVKANDASREYGATDPTFNFAITGFKNSETAAALGLPGTIAGSTTASATSAAGTTYTITPDNFPTLTNYSFTGSSGTLTITKAVLTVKANDASREYGSANPAFTFTFDGFKNSDTESSLGLPGSITGSTAATLTSAAGSTHTITPGNLPALTNYTLTGQTGTLTIDKATLTVKANDDSREYGSANPAFSFSFSGFKNSDTENSLGLPGSITGNTTATLTSAAGGAYPITPGNFPTLANYTLTGADGSLTIDKADLTIRFSNVSRPYGSTDLPVGYSMAGFKNGENARDLDLPGEITFSTTATATSAAGTTHPVTPGNLPTLANYRVIGVDGTLTIDKATLTVKADNTSRPYGDPDPDFTFTFSGLQNSETESSLGLPGAITASTTATAMSAAGTTYPITPANFPTLTNYTLTGADGTLTIDKAVLTVKFGNVSRPYGATHLPVTYAITGFKNGESGGDLGLPGEITFSTTATATSAAGTTHPVTPGNFPTLANYRLIAGNGILTIDKMDLTIKANDRTKIVNRELIFDGNEYTVTSGDVATGDAITGVTLSSVGAPAGAAVGTYDILISDAAGIAANNYNITYQKGTLEVQARPVLTVKAGNAERLYGAADPAFTYTITGFIDGDTEASLTGTPALTATATLTSGVGAYPISITDGTLASPKYAFSYEPGTLTIHPVALTVTAEAKGKTYGQADPGLTYEVTGGSLVNGDVLTGTLKRESGENAGEYAITEDIPFTVNGNYTLTFKPATLTIHTKPLVIKATAQSREYKTVGDALSYTQIGLESGDNLSGELSRAPGENAGVYPISQGTLTAGANYTITFEPADYTITPRSVTVTATALMKVYGEADPELEYTIPANSLEPGDAMTGKLRRAPGENAGKYAITLDDLSAGPNYTIAFTPAELTISPRPISIEADHQTKTYGDADPDLTYTITSGTLVGNDQLSGTLTRTAGENVGEYLIEGSQIIGGSNYSVQPVAGKLTITPKAITVTAFAKTKEFGDTDPDLTYRITSGGSLVSGDTFTGRLTRTAGEAVGDYTISRGDLDLSGNYELTYVPAILTISTRALMVTADAKNKTYGDADPSLTAQITSGTLISGDVLQGTLQRAAGENAGTYAITAKVPFSVNGNYTVTFVPSNLTIDAKGITVKAEAKGKTYGEADPEFTYKVTGTLLNGDAFSGSLSRTPGENAGQYTITRHTLSAGDNYSITYEPAALTISTRSLTVTADAHAKTYGDADPEFTYTVTAGALISGDTFSGRPGRETGENTGEYGILQNSLTAGDNYALTFVPSTLTIGKADLIITADDKSRTQGSADPLFTASGNGFKFGETFAALSEQPQFSTTATAASVPGTYPIVVSGAASGNYNITYVNGTLTVTVAGETALSNTVITERKPMGTVIGELESSGTVSSSLTYSLVAGSGSADNALFTISGNQLKAATIFNYNTRSNYKIRVRTTDHTGVYFDTEFTLTVKEVTLAGKATNLITPNGDGVNDTWAVKDIEQYPDNEVQIFDRGGKVVYRKRGYTNDWDGTSNGRELAEDTYYYVVTFGAGSRSSVSSIREPVKGFVTLVRNVN